MAAIELNLAQEVLVRDGVVRQGKAFEAAMLPQFTRRDETGISCRCEMMTRQHEYELSTLLEFIAEAQVVMACMCCFVPSRA